LLVNLAALQGALRLNSCSEWLYYYTIMNLDLVIDITSKLTFSTLSLSLN